MTLQRYCQGRWNSPKDLWGCRQPRRLEDSVQNMSLQTAVWFLATRCGGRTLMSCEVVKCQPGNLQNGRTVLLIANMMADSESGSLNSNSSFLVTISLSRLVSNIFMCDRQKDNANHYWPIGHIVAHQLTKQHKCTWNTNKTPKHRATRIIVNDTKCKKKCLIIVTKLEIWCCRTRGFIESPCAKFKQCMLLIYFVTVDLVTTPWIAALLHQKLLSTVK